MINAIDVDSFELVIGGDRRKNPDKFRFRYMTRDEALSACNHIWFQGRDGSARQAKVNGKVRTWKRNPDRIEVPIKYGMYEYATLSWDGNRLTNGVAYALVPVGWRN